MRSLDTIGKEELRDLLGKGWLTHDGMWFYSVYREYGIESANKLNKDAIKAMVPVEVQRLTQITGIAKGQLKSLEDIRDFVLCGMELILPSSVLSRLHFSTLGGDVLHWEWEKNECFAYKGMSRMGVIDRYECGVMYRIECWLESLDLKFIADPRAGKCLMQERGYCAGDYAFQF
jgi:hypothetical protein